MQGSGRIRVPTVARRVESKVRVRLRARRRVRFLALTFGISIGLIAIRGAYLCVQPDPRIVDFASVQRWDQVMLRAERGDVFDRNGERIVTSIDSPNIIVDPAWVEEEERAHLASQVASILELPVEQVEARMMRKTRYAKLASRVHPRVAQAIKGLGHRALFIEQDSRRYYPERALASQVLGYVDRDGDGRMGLENSFHDYLAGSTVLLQRRRDLKGLDVERLSEEERAPNAGMDVYTTLDRQIQRITERALEGVQERHEPKAAMGVVVDITTGDILAMASTPTYNPNVLGGDPRPRRNRVIQDAIEPGSVFKPFTMAAALEEHVVEEHSTIDCENGAWYVGRTRIGDDHPHGVVTAGEVIKYSSNIGVAKLALRMGARNFLGYLGDFGFGNRTGVMLPGERDGDVRDPRTVKPIELATTAYGQGTTATTLQLAMGIAAIGNGGVRMNPRIVTRVVDADGVPAFVQNPEPVMQVVSRESAEAVTRMMVSVTEEGGTATRARVPGYLVAGKTGTAEKVVGGHYTSARIGSFVGFLPADDPKIAIVVVVDEPQKGSRYGGIVAAPAFAEIGIAAMAYLGIEPNVDVDSSPAVLTIQPDEPEALAQAVTHDETGAALMPDVQGHSLRSALVALEGHSLRLDLSGSGRVITQQPPPGTALAKGSAVSLRLN